MRIQQWLHCLTLPSYRPVQLGFVAALDPLVAQSSPELWNVFHGCYASRGWDGLQALRCTMTSHHNWEKLWAIMQQQTPRPADRVIQCTKRDTRWWFHVGSILFCPYVLQIDAAALLHAIHLNRVPAAVLYVVYAQHAQEGRQLRHWLGKFDSASTTWVWKDQLIHVHNIQFWLMIHSKKRLTLSPHPMSYRLTRHVRHYTAQLPTQRRKTKRTGNCDCLPIMYKRQKCHSD
jgi:hypothetical protein